MKPIEKKDTITFYCKQTKTYMNLLRKQKKLIKKKFNKHYYKMRPSSLWVSLDFE
jgi:hypothetical protein